MSFYASKAGLVGGMMQRFGQMGAIRRTTATGGGPAATSDLAPSSQDYPARMAVFPVSLKDVDGTLVKAGDFRVLVEPLAVDPTTTDRVVCSEGVLTIVDAGKFAPAGTVTHYSMVARR